MERIIAFLGTQEAEGLKAKEIAARFGVHEVTVYKCKREAKRRRTDAPEDKPEIEIEKRLAGLSPEDQRRVLSDIALSAPREGDRVAALSSLQRLDASQGVKTSFGPRAPMTEEERKERLARLMGACGRTLVLRALRKARAMW